MGKVEEIELWADNQLRKAGAYAKGCASPIAFVFGILVQIGVIVFGVLVSIWRVIAPVLTWIAEQIERFVNRVVALIRPEDPFRLRQHGENLLSDSVRRHLKTYTLILVVSGTFELFAWGILWAQTGIAGVFGVLIPIAFALAVTVLDREIMIMDGQTGRKRWSVIFARSSMLVLLAMITAIPVELVVFRSEIDRVLGDAEKVEVDAIRAKAVAYETDLATQQKATSATIVTAQPKDIVDRRQEERAALVAQQTADRRAITARLSTAEKSVTTEVASGSKYGKTKTRGGSGVTAADLRRQETQTRIELDTFNKNSREQLTAFDAETERMRSEAALKGVEEIARRDMALTVKLQEVEAMPAEELAARYGGEYKQPDGFLTRFRTLLAIVEDDPVNGLIVWGCRIIMIVFGMIVLFVKFVKSSPDLIAYYSMKAQALSGNVDVVRVFIANALGGDAEAVAVLRMVARDNVDAKATLEKLGYGANVETAGWAPEVHQLHARHQAAQDALVAALNGFRSAFRELCERRDGNPPLAMERHRLEAKAERLWNVNVQPAISALTQIDGEFVRAGVRARHWSPEFDENDPRVDRVRLWKLKDVELVERFGWSNPAEDMIRSATPVGIA